MDNKQNQFKLKEKYKKFHIKYRDIHIKQHSKVKYLGCVLDERMSRKAMALNIVNKINNQLNFLYRKNNFLTSEVRRVLCNTAPF